jgi:hypothetical protein
MQGKASRQDKAPRQGTLARQVKAPRQGKARQLGMQCTWARQGTYAGKARQGT